MSKYTIGIDLGGTTMTAGLVDENYKIIGKTTWATRLPRPAEDLEKALADLCRTVAKENKVDFTDVKYVGIGTPGSVNFTTGFVGFVVHHRDDVCAQRHGCGAFACGCDAHRHSLMPLFWPDVCQQLLAEQALGQ